MILRTYLTAQKKRVDDFAKEIDASRGAVLKWISGERYPRYDYLQRIYEATQGAVTANDFYERKAKQVQQQKDGIRRNNFRQQKGSQEIRGAKATSEGGSNIKS
jgi:transcriptional regulator with XRE-family HTH domain